MPMYEYHCEANGQTVEVVHRMSERFETWGELCEKAGIDAGKTPAATPVKRLIGSGSVTNQNDTVSKRNARHGESSKNLRHGPMAAPARTNRILADR